MTWEEINAAIAEKVTAAKSAVKTEGLSTDDAEKAKNEALATELKNMPHEVRQFLHDGGHRQATAQSATKLKASEDAHAALKTGKATLETQVQEHKDRIAEMEAKTPDIAAQRAQLQKEFADREDELKGKVTDAEAKVTTLQDARKGDRVDGFENRLRASLGSQVTEEGQEWMRNRIDRMRLDGRFIPEDSDTGPSVAVLRPNSTELRYMSDNEGELLTVVSQEVLEGAPKWAIKSNVKGGGGASGGGTGGGVDKWDKIREDTKNRGVTPGIGDLKDRRAALIPQD